MLTLSTDTTQLDRAADALRNAERTVTDALTRELAAVAGDVAIDASLYPPQPAGSAYVRTGDLGDGWGVDGGGLVWAAVNAVPYAPFVMGPSQARPMAHWRTTPIIAEQWRAQAAERLAEVATQALEGAL